MFLYNKNKKLELVEILNTNLYSSIKEYKKVRLIHYETSHNLGDVIQYLGLKKLLKYNKTDIILRNHLPLYKQDNDEILIVNGWHCRSEEVPNFYSPNTLFIGFYGGSSNHYEWMKESKFPIGCRDPHTYNWVKSAGLRCYLSGCFSLVFNEYNNIRMGIIYNDCSDKNNLKKVTYISNHCDISPPNILNDMAIRNLNSFKKAEMVYTSRLHCALPCIAFNTPFEKLGLPSDGRTSILDYLEDK